MAVLHISEAEAVRDPAALLSHVRAGFEVVIEDDQEAIARLIPSYPASESTDADYDTWFASQIDDVLADTREGVDSEIVEAEFARRRQAAALRISGIAG